MLKNTLTDEQLCSLTCFLISACLNMYQNIYSFIAFKIRKKDWAKWAKWARILIDMFSCNCLLRHISKYLFIYRIWNQKKKTKLNELNELECSKTPSQMSSYAHKHVFLYLHAQTNISTLLYCTYIKS